MELRLLILILPSVIGLDTALSSERRCQFTHWGEFGIIDSQIPEGSQPRTCSWILEMPVQRRVELHFHDLEISNPNCSNDTSADYLRIAKLIPETVVMFKYYCTKETPSILMFDAVTLNITLRVSDGTNSTSHFRLAYRVVDEPECVQEYRAERGVLMSPNYPGQIPTAVTSTYKITAPKGFVIRLRLTHLDIETTDGVCINYFIVRDGADDNSPLIDSRCSRSYYLQGLVYQSSRNQMFIKLATFHPLQRLQGFHAVYDMVPDDVPPANYSAISAKPPLLSATANDVSEFDNSNCAKNFHEPSGVILSPNYPYGTQSPVSCTYQIVQPPGARIRLSLTHFNVLNSKNEIWGNYMEIRNGSDERSSRIASFYGMKYFITQQPLISENSVFIKFEASHGLAKLQGFHAVYDTVYEQLDTSV